MPPKATRASPPIESRLWASINNTLLPFFNDSSVQTRPAIPAPIMIISECFFIVLIGQNPNAE